jgi:hypothetical protein
MVRVDGHHLELYSEYWTALPVDGEDRFGSGGSVGRRFGAESGKQISPRRCASVEMTGLNSGTAIRLSDGI